MSFFRSLKMQFAPPKITDPDFGQLRYMYVSNHPERSYWECEWMFPKTKTPISIALPGDENGPKKGGRDFYLGLVSRYDEIIELARPKLGAVFQQWLQQPLPREIHSVVKLAGFDVEDISAAPLSWSISFETTGEKWLGIIVPFIGDQPQTPTVDT